MAPFSDVGTSKRWRASEPVGSGANCTRKLLRPGTLLVDKQGVNTLLGSILDSAPPRYVVGWECARVGVKAEEADG